MKKISLYVFLILMICNVGFAECIKGDCSNGYGTYTMDNGNKYVGEWKDGLPNGQGTEIHANGNKYVGEFKKGKYHGQGTYTWTDGSKYVGIWKDGKQHGQGTYTWVNGNKYVGEWKDGLPNGQGTEIHANGTVINGIWNKGELVERNNIKTQIAKKEPEKKEIKKEEKTKEEKKQVAVETKKEEKYQTLPECRGTNKNSWTNCHGTWVFPGGEFIGSNKYVGQWKDGAESGFGTHTSEDGKYVGQWKHGRWDGFGIWTECKLFSSNKCVIKGKVTTGVWRAWQLVMSAECIEGDCMNGQGTVTFANGYKYVGGWKDGELHGQGTLTEADGTVKKGIWKNDELIEQQY